MNRECPNCASEAIPVKNLLFRDVRCPACAGVVGIHRAVAILSSVVIFVVAAASTLLVFIEQGLYAALFWIPLPVGALSYLKARFGPLETKSSHLAPK